MTGQYPKVFEHIYRERSDPQAVEAIVKALKTVKSTFENLNFAQIPYDVWIQTRDLHRELGSVTSLLEKCHADYEEKQAPSTWTDELGAEYSTILNFINDTPEVLSLLYDLNLLPECVEKFSFPWCQMINVASHMHTLMMRTQKEAPPSVEDKDPDWERERDQSTG